MSMEEGVDGPPSTSPVSTSQGSRVARVPRPRPSPNRGRRDPVPVEAPAAVPPPSGGDQVDQPVPGDGASGFSFLSEPAAHQLIADPPAEHGGFSFMDNSVSQDQPVHSQDPPGDAPSSQGDSIWLDMMAQPKAGVQAPAHLTNGDKPGGDAFWFMQDGGAGSHKGASAHHQADAAPGGGQKESSSLSSFLNGSDSTVAHESGFALASASDGQTDEGGPVSLSAFLDAAPSAQPSDAPAPVSLSAFLEGSAAPPSATPASDQSLSAFLEGGAPSSSDNSLSAFLGSHSTPIAAPAPAPSASNSIFATASSPVDMFSSLDTRSGESHQPSAAAQPMAPTSPATPAARKGGRVKRDATSSFVPANQLKSLTPKSATTPTAPSPAATASAPVSPAPSAAGSPGTVPLTGSLDSQHPLAPTLPGLGSHSPEAPPLVRAASSPSVAAPAAAAAAAPAAAAPPVVDPSLIVTLQQLEKQKEAFEEFKSRELARIAALDGMARDKDKRIEDLTLKLARERQAAADESTAAAMKEAEVLAKLQQCEKQMAEFEAKKAKWEERLAKYEADKMTIEQEKKKIADQHAAVEQIQSKSDENEFLVQDLQLQLTTKEREWERKMNEKLKALTDEMDKARRMHDLSERQHKMQLNSTKEGIQKAAEEQRKREIEALKKEHEAAMKKQEQHWHAELEALKKENEGLKQEVQLDAKRAAHPTFDPAASVEIRALREELDRAQELFEQEKKEIHARYAEEREAEQKHQAFREEQHRVLVEENKKLEEKFEHIEEKARQLERAKHDYEKKGSELEAAKAKAGADVMQRVAVEKKKLEAEFAVKLERSGAAALNAECEKLKKTIAQLTLTEELEAARGELTAQRQQLAQEKAAASESERGLRVQNDTLRAELAARDKKGMAEADVVYLKNTILQFMQAEQKEQQQSMPVLCSLFKISPDEARKLADVLRKRGVWKS